MAGNTQDKRVNDQRLRGLRDGGTLTESMSGRGTGSILFKKIGSVTTAYYRWNLNKKPGQLSIGQYKSTPSSSGMMLSEIREKARELVDILLSYGCPKDYFTRQDAEARSQVEAEAKAADEMAKLGSFKDLLDSYSADLAARERVKAPQIARMFTMHVIEPFPELARKPAREITDADIFEILSRLKSAKPRSRGKGNTTPAPATSMRSTTDTLHTYLSAAFKRAKKTKRNLERPNPDAKNFGLTHNPAEDVGALENVYTGDTESLQQPELMELLLHLDMLPEHQRAIALAPIYLGGQRLKMLLDLRWEHVDDQGMFVFDKKGNRTEPHPHFLPFTPRILEIMAPLLETRFSDLGPFALSQKLVGTSYASKFYSGAGTTLSEAGKTRYFSWKEVRATAESVLAGLGVAKETRAHLLSHGRTDVQDKHYDRNVYLREKIDALEAWCQFLDNVKKGVFRTDIKIVRLSEIRPSQPKPAK
ncbi:MULTISPECIES: tyrosine-type recombinase/integrase [unclassified Pseudomonas]|uniref:tyrosine-type recombinase/integrase n=1 Tax=unclassified Pseudomonas TaxID=196821 RepID=UPI001CC09FF5|nr:MULTISPECIES: integrase [unclassified Pseudomonas]